MKKYTKPLIIAGLLVVGGVVGAAVLKPEFSNVKADSSQVRESYTAMLSADQEVLAISTVGTSTSSVQATTSPQSQGVGDATFNMLDSDTIAYRVHVSNLTSPITDAHLHCAAVGQNGPVIVPLVASSTSSGTEATLTGNISEDDITAAGMVCSPNIKTIAHLAQAIREGSVYVNVHTQNYPDGEVRGQLLLSNQILDLDATATSTIATSTTATSTDQATSTDTTTNTDQASTTSDSSTTSTSTYTVTDSNDSTTTSPSGWYYVFVRPDAYYKIQGSSMTFTGSHFVPGESVTIKDGGSNVGTVTADASGNFTTNAITVPYGVGNRTYTFTGASSKLSFPVQINVGNGNPWITLSTYYAGAGAPLTVIGQQFGANETVNVSFNGVNLGSAKTDANGTFSLSTTVPSTGQGQWKVTATGATTQMSTSQSFSQSF